MMIRSMAGVVDTIDGNMANGPYLALYSNAPSGMYVTRDGADGLLTFMIKT